MPARTFTPAEANRTLPLVKRVVRDILEKGRRLRTEIEREEQADEALVQQLHDELQEHVRELEQIGCQYKGWGFDKGLVDFPGYVDGELVYLCWEVGEERVAWYHGLEAGYAGRRPLPEESLAPSRPDGP